MADILFVNIYFISLVAILGLIIGSFLNVCIYRIPIGKSFVKNNSHCMQCGAKIKPYDLIPVISFLFLKGKCRNCKTAIAIRYPIIELINCTAYLIIYFIFGISIKTLICFALISVLIVVSMIDIDTQEVPNGLHIFLLCIAPFTFILNDVLWWERLTGFFAASSILLLISLITNGFGGADIKLMAVCGLFLGYINILLALLIGIVVGGISGIIILYISKYKERKLYDTKSDNKIDIDSANKEKATMPFCPSLSTGIFIALLFGKNIISWYISLLQI